MRDILFRGKSNWTYGTVKQGDWLYSMTISPHCYTDEKITSYYIGGGNNTIDATTLGQYTGLTDKNGTKIFEGDIVNVNTNKDSLCHRYEGRNLVIRFDEYHRFVASGRLEYPLCNHYEWEVIGNIYDKLELLKEGAE